MRFSKQFRAKGPLWGNLLFCVSTDGYDYRLCFCFSAGPGRTHNTPTNQTEPTGQSGEANTITLMSHDSFDARPRGSSRL